MLATMDSVWIAANYVGCMLQNMLCSQIRIRPREYTLIVRFRITNRIDT